MPLLCRAEKAPAGAVEERAFGPARCRPLRVAGIERGQRNVGAVNLQRIAEALGMSLSEFFAEGGRT